MALEVVADSHHISSNGAGEQVNFPCSDPVAQSSNPGATGFLFGFGDALNARVFTLVDQPGFLAVPSPDTGTAASLSGSIQRLTTEVFTPINQSSGSLEKSHGTSSSCSESVSTSVPMDQFGVARASSVAPFTQMGY
ncbi:hypothetical protein GOBAR_DD15376 [Gossypium barbadense]|nr:hypothetical protein GOBAR_DD15376 [Gossypium barbadense]